MERWSSAACKNSAAEARLPRPAMSCQAAVGSPSKSAKVQKSALNENRPISHEAGERWQVVCLFLWKAHDASAAVWCKPKWCWRGCPVQAAARQDKARHCYQTRHGVPPEITMSRHVTINRRRRMFSTVKVCHELGGYLEPRRVRIRRLAAPKNRSPGREGEALPRRSHHMAWRRVVSQREGRMETRRGMRTNVQSNHVLLCCSQPWPMSAVTRRAAVARSGSGRAGKCCRPSEWCRL